MNTVTEILTLSTSFLQQHHIAQPRRQAEELLSYALQLPRMDLYLQHDRPLLENELSLCREGLKRRASGEPIAYIRGSVPFLDCEIDVNRSVLIPRPETEILTGLIIEQLASEDTENKVFADLCCGSGCIGIALKKRLPGLNVLSVDLSPEALAQTQHNAKKNGVSIDCLAGDFTSVFQNQQLDFLVCNPPYISESDYASLDSEVKNFEPKGALMAEDNGYAFYKRLAGDARRIMKPKGKIWLEIGSSQGPTVSSLFTTISQLQGTIKQDWAGHDRFFLLEIE